MTIRMLQAWNGLHQQKIVTTLSGSDEASLVAAGIATYDLDGPAENLCMAQIATDAAGDVVGGFGACVNVFANRPDLADENTKLIQLALDVGGSVNVVASGEVYISSELVMGDNTTFYVGPETIIKSSAGTNKPVIISSSVRASGNLVNLSWSAGYDATVTFASHGKKVGDYVWLYGDSESPYRGVFAVKTVIDSNSFIVRLIRVPSASPGSQVWLKTPNIGQRIICDGVINYNATENNSASGVNNFAVIMAGVSPTIERANFIDVKKYCVCIGAALRPVVKNIHAIKTNSDILKLYGPIFGGVVDMISGVCNDDGVSIQPKEPPAYSQYDWTNGDILDVSINNIKLQSTSTSPFAIYATSGEFVTNIKVDNVWAAEHSSIPVRIQSGSGLTSCSVGTVTIRRARRSVGDSSYPVVKASINGTVQRLNILDLDFERALSSSAQVEIGTTATIGMLHVSRMTGSFGVTGYAVLCYGSVKFICIENSTLYGESSYTGRLLSVASAACEKIVINNNSLQSLDKVLDVSSSAASGINVSITNNTILSCYGAIALNKSASVTLSGNNVSVSVNGFVRLANGITANIYSAGTNDVSGPWITRAGSEVANIRGLDIKADITAVARFDGGMLYNTNASASNGADGACGVGIFVCNGTASGSWKKLGTAGAAGDRY